MRRDDEVDILYGADNGDNDAVVTICSAAAKRALGLAKRYARTAGEADDLVFEACRTAVAALQASQLNEASFSMRVVMEVRLHGTSRLLSQGCGAGLQHEAEARLALDALRFLPVGQADLLWSIDVEQATAAEYFRAHGTPFSATDRELRRARDALVERYLQSGVRHGQRPEVRRDHVSYQTALSYVRHELIPTRLAPTQLHLERCALCRLLVAELVTPGSSLQTNVGRLVPKPVRHFWQRTVKSGPVVAAKT